MVWGIFVLSVQNIMQKCNHEVEANTNKIARIDPDLVQWAATNDVEKNKQMVAAFISSNWTRMLQIRSTRPVQIKGYKIAPSCPLMRP